jgi:peroxiredoxin
MIGDGRVSPLCRRPLWSATTSCDHSRGLVDRLVGRRLPPVAMAGFDGPLNLWDFAMNTPLVIYFYPGSPRSPDDGDSSLVMDGLEHRAFRDHQPDLEAMGSSAVGVSSQSLEAQLQILVDHAIPPRQLLRDTDLHLASELGLATFMLDGARWYRRLTLIAIGGEIVKAWAANPGRTAAQSVAWMQLRGIWR